MKYAFQYTVTFTCSNVMKIYIVELIKWLYNPDWPPTPNSSLVSVSQVLELQAFTPMPSPFLESVCLFAVFMIGIETQGLVYTR